MAAGSNHASPAKGDGDGEEQEAQEGWEDPSSFDSAAPTTVQRVENDIFRVDNKIFPAERGREYTIRVENDALGVENHFFFKKTINIFPTNR